MDETKMAKLYEEYGRLMVQMELVQGRTNEVKRQIADEINKSSQLVSPAPENPSPKPV